MSAFEWLLRLLKIELRNEVIDTLNVVNITLRGLCTVTSSVHLFGGGAKMRYRFWLR
jgi:hypothetical protein